MSSSEPARLELASPNSLLEISVIGQDFRPVARGVGKLEASVAPGIYQIVTRAGPAVERQLVSLAPGDVHAATDLAVAYPSAAPVAGSSTSHEYHMALAEEASRKAPDAGASSALVFIVRDPRGLEGPPLDGAVLTRLELLDGDLRPIASFSQGWDVRAPEAAAAWSGPVEPGPYVLRSRAGALGPTDRALWVQRGWQTVVFLTLGPAGELPAATSVHMVDVNLWWSPVEERVSEAAELAALALEAERPIVPPDLLGLLLNTKFRNPMFGLIAAHAVLLEPTVDAGTLGVVLDNLDSLLPGHPDAVALRWLAAERLPQSMAMPGVGPGVTWPPMLLASYQALLRADAREPGVIQDGSPAERVAASLSMQGIWTTWRPLGPAIALPPAGAPPDALAAPPSDALAAPPEPADANALLTDLGPHASDVAQIAIPDRATARVARYLGTVAELEGPEQTAGRFEAMTTGELALATGLPTATVERSVRELHRMAAPPEYGHTDGDGGGQGGGGDGPGGGGGGGPNGPHIPAALLMAIALLLLVGLGAVIGLVVTDDDPDPTPTATAAAAASASSPAATDPPTATPSPNVTATAAPTPLPVPDVRIDPEELDFGVVLIEGTGDGLVTVVSTGTAPLTVIDALIGEGQSDFAALSDDCVGRTLQPAESCAVAVTFSPTEPGERIGTLVVDLEQLGSRVVNLTGAGEPIGAIQIDPDPAFPGTDWTPVTVTAQGPVRIADARLEGEDAPSFELDPAGCVDQPEFGQGATCELLIRLHPETNQDASYSATLVVETAGGAIEEAQVRWDDVD